MKIATAKAAGEVVERAWKAQGKLSVAAWFLQVFRTPPPAGLPTAPHLMFAAALLPGRGPLAAPHLVTVASLSPGIGRQNGPLAPQLGSPQTASGWGSGLGQPQPAIPLPAPHSTGFQDTTERTLSAKSGLTYKWPSRPRAQSGPWVFSEGVRVSCFRAFCCFCSPHCGALEGHRLGFPARVMEGLGYTPGFPGPRLAQSLPAEEALQTAWALLLGVAGCGLAQRDRHGGGGGGGGWGGWVRKGRRPSRAAQWLPE